MYPSPKFTREDFEVIRKRLTTHHLIDKTMIFYSPDVPIIQGSQVAIRFEQYWDTWVEQQLATMFEVLDRATRYEPIEGGVIIHGDGFKRTVMNSWYCDLNTDSL